MSAGYDDPRGDQGPDPGRDATLQRVPPPHAPPPYPGGPMPPPAAVGAPPPKKGRRRLWIAVGVVAVLLAIGGFSAWQESQAYDKGHAAYLAADCVTAAGYFRQAGGDDTPRTSDSETVENARAELQECETFLAAGDLQTQGRPADALLAYRDFIVAHPRSPLLDTAMSKAIALADAATAATTTELCDDLESLETMTLLGTPPAVLPELLFNCGNEYADAEKWTDALVMYSRFRDEFPDHARAGEVEAAFAVASLAEAEAGGAGELAPPPGFEGGAVDVATVVIVNDAPDPINIVFSGAEVRVEDIPPCPECQTLTEDPGECPNKGPLVEYELRPGTYTVVVKSGTSILTVPFRGTWELEAGFTYEHCFYIISNG